MSTFYSYSPPGSNPPSGVATPVVALNRVQLRDSLNQEFGKAQHQAQRYFQIGCQYHKMPHYVRSGSTFYSAEHNAYCADNFIVRVGANEPLNLIQVFRQNEWAYKECMALFDKPEAQLTPKDLVEVEKKVTAMRAWNQEADQENKRLGEYVGRYENTLENLKENVWSNPTLRVSERQKSDWATWKAELPYICDSASVDTLR